ncbi:hypothetical protein [Intrasporangium sp. DVR]|uniref:hypothetical protein n=1 Tax=Intrasporangium sp. DVR TaxID=3127867 RepID=UPI00333E3F97
MSSSIPIAAGALATAVFVASALPMLGKAARTKDLASYSRSSLVMANVGNVLYSVYVFNLPPGPIWLLHGFYLTSSALMLLWSLRYAARAATPSTTEKQGTSPCLTQPHPNPSRPRPLAVPSNTSRP